MEDQIKERIRYYTEWVRLLWIALIGLAGGIYGLVLALDSPVRVALLIFAVILGIVATVIVFRLHLAISRLIGQLKGEKR